MATANLENQSQLRQLAELILAVAGESVTVMKRNAPERALKLKRHDEWSIYLEFLKVMFNLTDRLSALYLPIKAQPQFMDSLEDAVTLQLKHVLEPTKRKSCSPSVRQWRRVGRPMSGTGSSSPKLIP
jgi:hypothetical protein